MYSNCGFQTCVSEEFNNRRELFAGIIEQLEKQPERDEGANGRESTAPGNASWSRDPWESHLFGDWVDETDVEVLLLAYTWKRKEWSIYDYKLS